MLVHQLLNNKTKWARFCTAINAKGKHVKSRDESAVAWSLVGAIHKCYQTKQEIKEVKAKLQHELTLQFGLAATNIDSFNNSDCTEFNRDIKPILEKLKI